LQTQVIVHSTMFMHAPGDAEHGGEFYLWLWSDAPNDLDRVVFMVRREVSKKTKEEVDKEQAKRAREDAQHPPKRDAVAWTPPPRADHAAPPAPLAEARPEQPPNTVWVPGYWTWTGTAWGWIAGSWRAARVAMPAPRVEVPGTPLAPNAVWIVGAWQRRAGTWVWIGGCWRP
jgi:hypothetical protein